MDLLLVWVCTFAAGLWACRKLREWARGPPGPWGVPLLGWLPWVEARAPHLSLAALAARHGPAVALRLGGVRAVLLSDARLVRDALAKDAFAGRAPLYMTHGIMQGKGVIFSEGALWREHRRQIAAWLKALTSAKQRASLQRRIAAGAHEVLQSVSAAAGTAVDLSQLVEHSLGNVVNDLVFGFKFPRGDRTWAWLRAIQEEACHEMGVAAVLNFLPFLRFLPWNRKTVNMIIRGQAQTHRLYAGIIARRRRMRGLTQPPGAARPSHRGLLDEHPEGHIKCVTYSKMAPQSEHYFDPEVLLPTEGECFLDVFLEEQWRRFAGDGDGSFATDEHLHYLLADLFGAGLDTTAASFAWFVLYMALHQDEQELVRKELQREWSEEGVEESRLPRLMAALSETQRIRSIVPVGIPHGCLEDAYIGDYRVPRGTMVMPLQWSIHMDPAVWDEPDQFRPGRFLADDGSLLKPQEFIPFQTGKRMCPGDAVSRQLAVGLAARLLRGARVLLAGAPPSPRDMQGRAGVTLTPPHVLYRCEPVQP